MYVRGTNPVAEVAAVFLRLGFTAFGGPAAHIAMMRSEVVGKRAWLSDEEFVELMGMTNLIPGPNSTQLGIHLGYRRAGVPGLAVAGVCFIVPAMLIVMALAWCYVRFGTLPASRGLLYGMKPVVVAIVLHALVGLGSSTIKTTATAATGLAVLALSGFGILGEMWLVFIPGLAFALASLRTHKPELATAKRMLLIVAAILGVVVASFGLATLAIGQAPYSLGSLFVLFLKVGSVLYGSGYVLLSYLNTDLVARLGWLTKGQLLDAVAVGQFTPGPVFTTATFIGFILGGVPGALIATVGIFLPSFFLVAASAKWLQSLKTSPTTQSFLVGVNAASIGLMGAVLIKLGQAALVDWETILLSTMSIIVVLLKFKINSFWLVLAGALAGLLLVPR
jgi:chromate transporter